MKILIVTAPVSFGGGEALMINLLKGSRQGVQIDVALVYSSVRFERELDKIGIRHYELEKGNIGHGITRLQQFLLTAKNIIKIPRLGKIIRKNRYDIVHANAYPAVFMVSMLKKRYKFRSIYTHHLIRSFPSKIEQVIFTHWYSSYDICTAVSQAACCSMNDGFPNNKKRFVCIYNCIADYFYTQPKSEKALFGHDRINFVQVARFTDMKNQECVAHAVDRLPEDIKRRVRVIFVGDGYGRKRIEKLITKRKLQNCFKFMGAKEPEEIPEILDSCDFGLMPSKAEGFGLGAVECMARGLPVLALDIPVLREIVGDAGYIRKDDDFHTAFIEAISDGEKKKDIAIRKASAFTTQNIKKEYARLYQRVMDGRPYEY